MITENSTAPNGLRLRDAVIGWELNNFMGFKDYDDAKRTWDHDRPPIGMLFKIRGEVYRVVQILGKHVFDFYDDGTLYA
jgi:hypothetical protein